MVNTNKLKGVIVENGMTQQGLAEKLDIAPKTLGLKLKRGIFTSDEIDKMIVLLHMDCNTVMSIFFAKEVNH